MNDTIYTLSIVIPILLVSISLHESMHAIAAYYLGDDTAKAQGRISINPLKHIDPFLTIILPALLVLAHLPVFGAAKPVQVNFSRVKFAEFGGAIIGAVGPLTNFLIAILAAFIFNNVNASGTLQDILIYTIVINIGFGVFNSIPWPPLDGSRVLYAFAPKPLQEIMDNIERWGFAGLILFMLVFYQLIAPIMADVISKLVGGLTNGII